MIIKQVTFVTDELVEAFQRLMPQLTANPLRGQVHPPPSRADLQALVAFPASTLLAARESDAGPIVGVATLSLLRTPSGIHAHLEDVVVDSAARGKGIGAALTEEALRLAKESGADYVALTSNPRREAANRLYQRLGFKKWDTNLYRYDLE